MLDWAIPASLYTGTSGVVVKSSREAVPCCLLACMCACRVLAGSCGVDGRLDPLNTPV